MQLEVHAMRFEDDDKKRATEPTFVTTPARLPIEPGEEVVIRAKDGVVHVTIDGKEQGSGMSLARWDYTAIALTYKETKEEVW